MKQEHIKDLTDIINRRCEAELGQIHTTSRDGKVTKTIDTSLIAKDIVEADYKKESKEDFDVYEEQC